MGGRANGLRVAYTRPLCPAERKREREREREREGAIEGQPSVVALVKERERGHNVPARFSHNWSAYSHAHPNKMLDGVARQRGLQGLLAAQPPSKAKQSKERALVRCFGRVIPTCPTVCAQNYRQLARGGTSSFISTAEPFKGKSRGGSQRHPRAAGARSRAELGAGQTPGMEGDALGRESGGLLLALTPSKAKQTEHPQNSISLACGRRPGTAEPIVNVMDPKISTCGGKKEVKRMLFQPLHPALSGLGFRDPLNPKP